jgi:hypothetical protein
VTDSLSRYWKAFAAYSLDGYAPIYNRIVTAMADDAEVLELVASGPKDTHGPNHLQAAVHYLLFDLDDHPLRAVYEGTSDADPGPLFGTFVRDHRDEIAELIRTNHVQTNEVGRVSAIGPSLAHVAQAAEKPIALIDIGTSAGLNLLFDRYRVDYATPHRPRSVGPSDAGVVVEATLTDGTPRFEHPEIAWRCGIDRSPVDVTNADSARWLRSLVWPDHRTRAKRLEAAIAEAHAHPLNLRQADAVEGVLAALRDAPDDALPVVLTTWAYFYFDAETREAFDSAITAAERPVAWVSMEMLGAVPDLEPGDTPGSDGEVSVMGLVTAGIDTLPSRSTLGFAHPHGEWLTWTAG